MNLRKRTGGNGIYDELQGNKCYFIKYSGTLNAYYTHEKKKLKKMWVRK